MGRPLEPEVDLEAQALARLTSTLGPLEPAGEDDDDGELPLAA